MKSYEKGAFLMSRTHVETSPTTTTTNNTTEHPEDVRCRNQSSNYPCKFGDCYERPDGVQYCRVNHESGSMTIQQCNITQ